MSPSAGLMDPSLVLHAVVGSVSMACARVRHGLPLRERDIRALHRAGDGLERQLAEYSYLRSAGNDGTRPSPGSGVDLASLLLPLRDDQSTDGTEFTRGVQEQLRRLAGTANDFPDGNQDEATRQLANDLGTLFDQATDEAASMGERPGERLLTSL